MQTSCPHCGQNYDVSAELLGKQVQCSTCTKPFNLPAASAATASNPAPALEDTTPVEVACPHCDARFHAPPALVGTTANCATCHQPFTVEKAETDFTLAPAEGGGPDPFGGLGANDPLGGSSSPLGNNSLSQPASYGGPLGAGGSSSFPSESSDSGGGGALIGVAKILGGLLMGIFGIVASMASYEAAAEGETYTMYYGLCIAGIALVGYGIRDIFVSQS